MYRSLEKDLYKWKNSQTRYPLLLRGARQVGKTYLIEKFGKEAFSSFVSVNFEEHPEAIGCFQTLDPEEILIRLQLILKQKISPGETLLFLDEIQVCPKAITALRYFKEKLPSLHVIGAGSLLEFTLIKEKFSFPVGRVQFMYLKPLSFVEYLYARKKTSLVKALEEISINKVFSEEKHQEILRLVKEYFIVGGMPAVVSTFCDQLSLENCSTIHEILLATYEADFSKYSKPSEDKYLKIIFRGIFKEIAKQFKYSRIDPDIKSRELKHALNHLNWAGLIYMIHASTGSGIPLTAQLKSSRFKVIFLDIGLAQHALQVDPRIFLEKDLLLLNRGVLTEQFVGQELLAYQNPSQQESLFFWQREKKTSDAEIDYLYPFHESIIPIEVKSGVSGRLKSMQEFLKEKKGSIGIQISQKPLSIEKNILSVPLYAVSMLSKLLKEII